MFINLLVIIVTVILVAVLVGIIVWLFIKKRHALKKGNTYKDQFFASEIRSVSNLTYTKL